MPRAHMRRAPRRPLRRMPPRAAMASSCDRDFRGIDTLTRTAGAVRDAVTTSAARSRVTCRATGCRSARSCRPLAPAQTDDRPLRPAADQSGGQAAGGGALVVRWFLPRERRHAAEAHGVAVPTELQHDGHRPRVLCQRQRRFGQIRRDLRDRITHRDVPGSTDVPLVGGCSRRSTDIRASYPSWYSTFTPKSPDGGFVDPLPLDAYRAPMPASIDGDRAGTRTRRATVR